MATRKQLKRRRKVRVHGTPAEASGEAREPARSAPKERKDTGGESGRGRRRRAIPEPSWRRSIQRGAFLFLGISVMFWLVGGRKHQLSAAAVAAIGPALLFVPLDYYMSRFTKDRLARRQERAAKTKK
jgi:hypothetical protein